MINPSSPISGSAITGFTAHTYTLTPDVYPNGNNGKQWAVTAVNGTQSGVTPHSVSSPFTLAFVRPNSLRTVGPLNAQGQITSVPKNTYKVIVRKGATPGANQPDHIAPMICEFGVPAGTDAYDAAEIKAALSLMIGFLSANSAGIADTLTSGVL